MTVWPMEAHGCDSCPVDHLPPLTPGPLMLAPRDVLYFLMMWVVVGLVISAGLVSRYVPQDNAVRLPVIITCAFTAPSLLFLLLKESMNYNGSVWRDGKYRRGDTGTEKKFCMLCSPIFWAEALATGFDSCGMDGGGLPRLALKPLEVPAPAQAPQLLQNPEAAAAAGGVQSAAAAAVAPEVPSPLPRYGLPLQPSATPAHPPCPLPHSPTHAHMHTASLLPPPQRLVVNPPAVSPCIPQGPKCMLSSPPTLSPSLLPPRQSAGLSKGDILAVNFPPSPLPPRPLPKVG